MDEKYEIKIAFDEEKLGTKLTLREHVACQLLLTLFSVVAPIKYNHQMEPLWKALHDLRKI